MHAFAQALSRFNARISFIALLLAGAGLIAMTLIVAWTVFGRYILNATPTWGEPASLFLMLWFILLGGAVGVREMDHMGFEVGIHMLQGRARAVLIAINEGLVAVFGFDMVFYGWQLAAKVWLDRIAMIGISKGWDYVPIIGGGILIALFSIEKLALAFSNQQRMPMPLGGDHLGEA